MKGTRQIKRFGAVMAVALVAIGALAGAALAGPGDAVLTGGTLSATSVTAGTFAGTLTGAALTLESTDFGGFVVTDPRGTGGGWSITMSATQFSSGDHQIPTGSLQMPQLAVDGNTGSSDDPGALRAATVIDGGDVVMANCTAAGQGMGIYTFSAADSAPWELSLAANQYAGTYNSTVTTTLGTAFIAP
jgi:hypothetical protein